MRDEVRGDYSGDALHVLQTTANALIDIEQHQGLEEELALHRRQEASSLQNSQLGWMVRAQEGPTRRNSKLTVGLLDFCVWVTTTGLAEFPSQVAYLSHHILTVWWKN